MTPDDAVDSAPPGRTKTDPETALGVSPPLSFGSGDDQSPLDSFVITNLLDLALNADDDDVRRKATRDLAEGRGLFARATAREAARYGLRGASSPGRDLVITDEKTFSGLLAGLRTLGLSAERGAGATPADPSSSSPADGPSTADFVSVEVQS